MTEPARPEPPTGGNTGISVARRVRLAVAAVTVALGVWGHRSVGEPWPDALYRTARLFLLNLDLDQGVAAPPQLWVAAVLAPILLVSGIAELFERQLRGTVVRFLRPEMVVFGTDHRAAALVRAHRLGRTSRWSRPVVVADPDLARLAAARAAGAWTVPADGLDPRALRRARVHRADTVVVATGDDQRNAAVATQLQAFVVGRRRRVFVEVDDPGLARAIEQPEGAVTGRATPAERQVPFSALTLAAGHVMDQLDRDDGVFLDGADVAPSLALFGGGPLVDAFALELRRRRRIELLGSAPPPPRPRLLIVGPDAEQRCAGLRTLLGAELDLLDVIAVPDPLGQALALGERTARMLLGHRLRRVLVLAADDLGGTPIALTLAHHLGRDGRLALVTAGPAGPFGAQIDARTKDDPMRAHIRVFRVPDEAYSRWRLEDHVGHRRLARALYEADGGPGWWPDLDDDERGPAVTRAQELRDDVEVALRSNAFMAFSPAEERVLGAVGTGAYTALARAGLSPDLRDPASLARLGDRLLEKGCAAEAFAVWAEVARLSTDGAALAGLARRRADADGEIRELLLVRRAQLGEAGALRVLRERGVDTTTCADTVVVVGGSAGDPPPGLDALLEWTFGTPPYAGTVLAPGPDNGVGAVLDGLARRLPLTLRCAADAAAARRASLDLLTRLACGAPGTVRVLALPGGPEVWLQLQVLRTLGVAIGWLPPASDTGAAPDPDRELLGGRGGVVDLPADRATVRAFLRPSRWPGDVAEREQLARDVHAAYVGRHRDARDPADPSLRPFAELPPALQDSNRAVVDDLPAKLAVVGLPDVLGTGVWPAGLPDAATLAVLAEMEHGRWNAERLLAGWASGNRDTAQFVSPHLKAWEDLGPDVRQWDVDVVDTVLAALQRLRRRGQPPSRTPQGEP